MGRSARRNRNRRRHCTGRRQASVALVVNYLNALPDELKEVIQSYVRFTPAFLTEVLELYEHDKKICIHRHGDLSTWDVSRLSLANYESFYYESFNGPPTSKFSTLLTILNLST